MLVAEEHETKARAVAVLPDKARDDGLDEKGVAAVDEEVELLQLDSSLYRRRH